MFEPSRDNGPQGEFDPEPSDTPLPQGRGEVAFKHGPFEVSFIQSFDESPNSDDSIDELVIQVQGSQGTGEVRFGRMPENVSAEVFEIILASDRSPDSGSKADTLGQILALTSRHHVPLYSNLGETKDQILDTLCNSALLPGADPCDLPAPVKKEPVIRVLDIPSAGPCVVSPNPEIAAPPAGTVRWIDIQGQNEEIINRLLDKFGFEYQAVNRCLVVDDRPRLDDYGDHLFAVMHALRGGADPLHPVAHELHTFLKPGLIITVHSEPFEEIDRSWKRTKDAELENEERRAEHILYRVAGRILSNNETAIDKVHREVEKVHDENQRKQITAERLQTQLPDLFSTLSDLRRFVAPLAPMFQKLAKRSDAIVDKSNALLFGNLPDHANHLAQDIEDARNQIEAVRQTTLVTTANTLAKAAVRIAIAQAVIMPIMAVSSFFGQNFTGLPFSSDTLMWGSMIGAAVSSLGIFYYFWKRKLLA